VSTVAAQPDDERPLQGVDLGWHRVVLICGDCEDRKDGPRHLTAKTTRRELKHALRDGPDKVRIVVTSCLGPCIRKAQTVVACATGTATAPAAFALCDESQLKQAAARICRR
jgi:hypothetical protein